MIRPHLLDEIKLQNEFLKQEVEYKHRELAKDVNKELKYELVQAIKGLRRAGKTILIKKLLKTLIEPFYFSFDEERFANINTLNEIIRYALSLNKKVIALDEIQKVKNWGGVIKKFYDAKKVKFLLSGSSAIEITKGKESLAGRLFEYQLHLLSLKEFKDFGGTDFLIYLKTGFPELVLTNIPPDRYIPTIVEKIVYEDIPMRYEIHRPEVLMDIVQLLAERNCNLVDYRDLASDLDISKDTVKTYVHYLEQSYLLDVVSVYAKRISTSKRRLKKVFFNFPSIPEIYYKQTEGQMVENAVYSELKRHSAVNFWRDRDYEVDFIVDKIPIEVKYSASINNSKLRGMLRFMNKFNVKEGLVVCKFNDTRVIDGQKIIFVDVERFLSNSQKILARVNK